MFEILAIYCVGAILVSAGAVTPSARLGGTQELAVSIDRDTPLFRVRVHDQFGFITATGKQVISPRFSWVGAFSEGLAQVLENDHIGYILPSGVLRIPAKYKCGDRFSGGLAAVRDEKGWGYINTSGNVAIPSAFEKAGRFTHGLAPVRINGKWGCIDPRGSSVVPPKYSQVTVGGGHAILVKNAKQYGLIGRDGRVLYPLRWDYATPVVDGCLVVREGMQWLIVDMLEPKQIALDIADLVDVRAFHDGAAVFVVKRNGEESSGLLQRNGEVRVEPRFDYIGDMAEGMAEVRQGWKYGYIDMEGRLVISPVFNWASSFRQGAATVSTSTGWGVINAAGEFVVGPEYDLCYANWNGLVLAYKAGERTNDGEMSVLRNGTWQYLALGGQPVWQTPQERPYYGTINFWFEPASGPGVYEMKRLGQVFE